MKGFEDSEYKWSVQTKRVGGNFEICLRPSIL